MPNWVYQRYELAGTISGLVRLKNWVEGLYPPPRWRHATYQNKRFLLLGACGYLRPVVPVAHLPSEELQSHGLGERTLANDAYTRWLTLLAGKETALDDETCRIIDNLYHSAELQWLTFDNLDWQQQSEVIKIIRAVSFDWYDLGFGKLPEYCEEVFDRPEITPSQQHLASDLRSILPPLMEPLLCGFNGSLFGVSGKLIPTDPLDVRRGFRDAVNEYGHNVARYGTKWVYLTESKCQLTGENQAVMSAQTAWSPPSNAVLEALVKHFGLDNLECAYMDEGYGFAGLKEVDILGTYTDQVDDVVTADRYEPKYEGYESRAVGPLYLQELLKELYDATE